MRSLLLICLVVLALPAQAQPTFALWVDDGGSLVNAYDVPYSTSFDMVVTVDSDGHDLELVTWEMTDAFPGLFRLNAVSPIGTCGLIPENCMDGSYAIAVYGCHPSGSGVEVMRITYADFTGTVGADLVAVIETSPPGPGFGNCSGTWIDATMGGSSGGTTSSGVTWPDGGLILNPTRPLPVPETSFAALKSRY